MIRTCIVAGCLLISAINGLPASNQRPSESPGKPGEKSLRSLDQVAYQDGVNRARSDLTDSYGNPINYDSLESIDAKKPSKQSDPNKFIIPGYASGILQPHEVPTRSSVETARKIDNDRIHFIDPLQNSQAPQSGLAAPLGTDSTRDVLPSQAPIDIPRPNIDSPQTPQAPIDDPLNHVLTPPQNDFSGGIGPPSFSLQTPGGNAQQPSVAQDLAPPQIPSDAAGIHIPRPNLDAPETPIDNSNGPLNQGLLPPAVKDSPSFTAPAFANSNEAGPVVFTDVLFAPKPSNGLLPPKDVSPNDINSNQSPEQNSQPTVPTANKFSFGSSSGIFGQAVDKFAGAAGQAVDKFAGSVGQAADTVQNKFTGSFGGPPGVLGKGPGASRPSSVVNQIPVVVVQSPPSPPRTAPNAQTFGSQPAPKATIDKYQGSFGGSPGVLVSNNQNDRVSGVAPSAAPAQPLPTLASPPVPSTVASPPADKFSGSFGGPPGVLGGSKVPGANPTTQTINQLPSVANDYPAEQKEIGEKYTGQFGGAPGILRPYDH